MTSYSEDLYIDYPPVQDLESKLKVLAYLVTLSLHYYGCDVNSTSTMLAYYGLGHLVGWVVQRIKDDDIVEPLRQQGRDKDGVVIHSLGPGFLDGTENTNVFITYVRSRPKVIEIQCRELLKFASRGDHMIARTANGRQIGMWVLTGRLLCYDLD